jgi:hypothetical protein
MPSLDALKTAEHEAAAAGRPPSEAAQ